jgi:hypothetical protein
MYDTCWAASVQSFDALFSSANLRFKENKAPGW